MADVDYVRKAVKALKDKVVEDIASWDPGIADQMQLAEWKKTLISLQATIERTMQETELHRRQVAVIKNEMEVLERAARSTSILDRNASIGVAKKAESMGKHLNEAKLKLAEMEEDETKLRDAAYIAEQKICMVEGKTQD